MSLHQCVNSGRMTSVRCESASSRIRPFRQGPHGHAGTTEDAAGLITGSRRRGSAGFGFKYRTKPDPGHNAADERGSAASRRRLGQVVLSGIPRSIPA
jgi:hypothetical protein